MASASAIRRARARQTGVGLSETPPRLTRYPTTARLFTIFSIVYGGQLQAPDRLFTCQGSVFHFGGADRFFFTNRSPSGGGPTPTKA